MSTRVTARSASVLFLGTALVLVTACGSTISSSPGATAEAPAAPSLSPRVTPTAAASSKAVDPPRVARPARGHTAAAPAHPAGTAAPRPGLATRAARPSVSGRSPRPTPTVAGRSVRPQPTATVPSAQADPQAPVRTRTRRRTAGHVDVVPARKVQTKPPVALGRRAQVSATVALEISSVTAVQVQGRLPGEISGPGVAVTVLVVNHSTHAVRVGDTVVALTDSSRAPGGSVTDDRARLLSGTLAPGRTARGTYVFTVPKDRRSPVTVTVTLTGESPVVQFVGAVR